MSEPLPAGYPKDGPDWIDPTELADETDRSDATKWEFYTHKVADTRRQFFGKLAVHRAIDDGEGWAMFTDDSPGSTAELGSREVLIYSQILQGRNFGSFVVPLARIITNESYMSEDYTGYVSEDITIMPSGAAIYCISAVQLDTYDSNRRARALMESPTPLFFTIDGKLGFTGNTPPSTPIYPVQCDLDASVTTYPFGDAQGMSDQLYALDKAVEILESVANKAPMWQHEY